MLTTLYDIRTRRVEYSNIVYPYGWEKKALTREMRRMLSLRSGRRELIMMDELHLASGGQVNHASGNQPPQNKGKESVCKYGPS